VFIFDEVYCEVGVSVVDGDVFADVDVVFYVWFLLLVDVVWFRWGVVIFGFMVLFVELDGVKALWDVGIMVFLVELVLWILCV